MTATDVREQPWFDAQAYPFAPHFLQLPMGRMHYLDEGSGPVVLLVHGTPGWSFEYRMVVKALSARYRVIAPDHLGFGLSDKPADWSYALQGHTENLRALLRHLKVERYTLVVHDFGGPVALPLALEATQQVERLVVMNSWLWPLSLDPAIAKQRKMMQSGLMRWLYLRANFSAKVMVKASWGKRSPLTKERHRHFTAMFPDAASRHGTLGFLRATTQEDAALEALARRLPALAQVPALVLWGAADTFIKPVHLERWRKELPRAEVVPLEGVGHFPHDEAGEEVARRILGFLEGTPQQRLQAAR
jgi:pimeloyl-ACP methyl ester carboxylesterase